jgi:hypothetical protein
MYPTRTNTLQHVAAKAGLRIAIACLGLLCMACPEGARAAQDEESAQHLESGSDSVVVVRRGESLLGIAARLLPATDFYTTGELAEGIRVASAIDSDRLMPGQTLHVPLVSGSRGRIATDGTEVRGLYVTARTAGSARILALADSLIAVGGNTIIFDIKDRQGDLSYPSRVPLALATQVDSLAPIRRPRALVRELHKRRLHVVARLTCFYDERLAVVRPELRPRSLSGDGAPWGKGWLDPSLPQVQDYLLEIVTEVSRFGVDEIQLDYVRFPTEGDLADALFDFDTWHLAKHEVITEFVARTRGRLIDTNVLLAADLFGVAAWGREADLRRLGQKLTDLLPLLDVASPMLYPSHFFGPFLGIERPSDYPYYLVQAGLRRLKPLAEVHGVDVRPWLQAFSYGVTGFNEQYVTEQILAARDVGAQGWMLWHPANRFDVSLEAMRTLHNGRVVESSRRQPELLGKQTVEGGPDM